MIKKFNHIDTWVFDLDNTLYDAESYVFVEHGKKLAKLISRHLGVTDLEAQKLRHHYYMTYGTTLRGMMTEHGLHPDEFLKETHDIDLDPVNPCILTSAYLSQLPGRKVVFTNSPRHFAERVLTRLGLNDHFDGVFTIEDADYWPKPRPQTYEVFFDKHGVDPKTACMFEDMEVNLKPAHDFGMTTVWVHGSNNKPDDGKVPHIHHISASVGAWLAEKFGEKK